ncbi:MAG: hypothetical protein ACLVKJ_01815 [Acutalibacteraceae bacterium]
MQIEHAKQLFQNQMSVSTQINNICVRSNILSLWAELKERRLQKWIS